MENVIVKICQNSNSWWIWVKNSLYYSFIFSVDLKTFQIKSWAKAIWVINMNPCTHKQVKFHLEFQLRLLKLMESWISAPDGDYGEAREKPCPGPALHHT